MKKSIIITVILAVLAIVTNAQNINIHNMSGSGSYFSGFSSTDSESWVVENLTVTQEGNTFYVSYSVYTVRESKYAEVPNDTTRYEYSGSFTKLTKRDGSGFDLKCNEDDIKFYTVSVSETRFDNRPEYDHFSIMIHYQIFTKGFYVHLILTPEQYQQVIK